VSKIFSNLLLEELVLLSLLQTELSFSVVELQRGLREFYWLGRKPSILRGPFRETKRATSIAAPRNFCLRVENSRVGVEGQATPQACGMHAFDAEAQQGN
jgi:hypothetical protein